MPLYFYVNSPFNIATKADALDFGTGTGSQVTYPVVNKTGTRIGSTIQFGTTEYFRNTGGAVVSGNSVTLSSPPAAGLAGVIPGVTAVVLSAFDNSNNIAEANPQQGIQKIYIANMDDIAIKEHLAVPGASGINIFYVNNIINGGPDLSWVQLACADPIGNMLTPLATGSILTLPPIYFFSQLSTSVSAMASSIPVQTASGFTPGMYCLINPGAADQEEVHVTSVDYAHNILFIDSLLNFSHLSTEIIYHNGWAMYAICNVPSGATNNTAINYYNIGLTRQCVTLQRP